MTTASAIRQSPGVTGKWERFTGKVIGPDVNWFQRSLLRRPFATSVAYSAAVFSWGRFVGVSSVTSAFMAVPLLALLLVLSFPRVGLLRRELGKRGVHLSDSQPWEGRSGDGWPERDLLDRATANTCR